MSSRTKKSQLSNSTQIGFIQFPVNYPALKDKLKRKIQEKIIDDLYQQVDVRLDIEINRIQYIEQIFLSTLKTAEEQEEFEYCALIRDMINLINEPTE